MFRKQLASAIAIFCLSVILFALPTGAYGKVLGVLLLFYALAKFEKWKTAKKKKE